MQASRPFRLTRLPNAVFEWIDERLGLRQMITALLHVAIRRQFMGVGLVIMAMAIGSLWVIRRELYKQLPKKE
jgi:hypothetical protein